MRSLSRFINWTSFSIFTSFFSASFVALLLLACESSPQSAKTQSASSLGSRVAKDKQVPSLELKTLCPEGPTLACYKKLAHGLENQNEVGQLEIPRLLCEAKAQGDEALLFKQMMCLLHARYLAAGGELLEARKTRERACLLDKKACIQSQSHSYNPDFFVVLDLASYFCEPDAVRPGALTKFFLRDLCSIKADQRGTDKLESAWVESRNRIFVHWLPKVESIQSASERLPVARRFQGASQEKIEEFYLSLRSRTQPIRVEFELHHIQPVALIGDFQSFESGVKKTDKLPLSGFMGHSGQGWSKGFSGYAALQPAALLDLSRKTPLMRSSPFKKLVTATVIGFRETGVVPVPVVVLDSAQ